MRDKIEAEEIGKVVVRAMEALQKMPIDENAAAEEKKQKRIDERYKRLGRLRAAGMINVLSRRCVERIGWGSLENTHHLEIVRAWMDADIPFIFLSGPSGVGKTVAGAWAVANFGGMFLRAQTLERAGLAVYGPYNELLQQAFEERLVLVDDIGTELRTSEFIGVLSELVNNRVGGRLKTIFTSNLERPRLEERYFSKRELSRLVGAAYISDKSEDMRLRDADQD